MQQGAGGTGATPANILEQEYMTKCARSGGLVPGAVEASSAHLRQGQTLGMRCRREVA